LTVIAGVNSSGKSSAIQPLLLLKQTLDTPYDPGPLQLSGPNVDITRVEQVLSRPVMTRSFSIGLGASRNYAEWRFGKDSHGDLRVQEAIGRFVGSKDIVSIHEGMTSLQLKRIFPRLKELEEGGVVGRGRDKVRLAVSRDRFFLFPAFIIDDMWAARGIIDPYPSSYELEREISQVIHLPALRGNPLRTYPTAAVEERYPATFEIYTAGVIAAWQNDRRADELRQLRLDLAELGLTWKVEAHQLDDTRVELLVGRLPRAQRGGSRDLVNIADVGFGVSQTLPVIVALIAARPGQLVYLEQPEIHLHPRAQATFANLVLRAVSRGVRVIVETHSSLFIRAIQTLVAEGRMSPGDVILHWFTRDAVTGDTDIATAELDKAGAFGDWPEDFDAVHLETEVRYLDAVTEARST
jgi:hypothetical protein